MSDGCVSMFCFMFVKWLVLWIGPRQMCICLRHLGLTVLRWPCVVDRTLKSSYLLTYLRALRIVSPDKILCCINTLIVINIILVMCNLAIDFFIYIFFLVICKLHPLVTGIFKCLVDFIFNLHFSCISVVVGPILSCLILCKEGVCATWVS